MRIFFWRRDFEIDFLTKAFFLREAFLIFFSLKKAFSIFFSLGKAFSNFFTLEKGLRDFFSWRRDYEIDEPLLGGGPRSLLLAPFTISPLLPAPFNFLPLAPFFIFLCSLFIFNFSSCSWFFLSFLFLHQSMLLFYDFFAPFFFIISLLLAPELSFVCSLLLNLFHGLLLGEALFPFCLPKVLGPTIFG